VYPLGDLDTTTLTPGLVYENLADVQSVVMASGPTAVGREIDPPHRL